MVSSRRSRSRQRPRPRPGRRRPNARAAGRACPVRVAQGGAMVLGSSMPATGAAPRARPGGCRDRRGSDRVASSCGTAPATRCLMPAIWRVSRTAPPTSEDHDGRAGGFALMPEQRLLGLDDMDACRAGRGAGCRWSARALPRSARRTTDIGQEVGGCQATGTIEQLVANGTTGWQALLGQAHSPAQDLIRGDQDRAAVSVQPEWHPCGGQPGGDLLRIGRLQAREQEPRRAARRPGR